MGKLSEVMLDYMGCPVQHSVTESIDCTKPGLSPTLSNFEEASICEHVKYMSSIGYGYSTSEVMSLVSEYLVSMGRREPGKPMSDKWFYNFLKRWPELKLVKPSSLEMFRAKNKTPEVKNKYFSELGNILGKYCLRDKPECIYFTGFNIPKINSNCDCLW